MDLNHAVFRAKYVHHCGIPQMSSTQDVLVCIIESLSIHSLRPIRLIILRQMVSIFLSSVVPFNPRMVLLNKTCS